MASWLLVQLRKKEKREEGRRNHRRESLVEGPPYFVHRQIPFVDGENS